MYCQWSLVDLPTSHWQTLQILCHQNPFRGRPEHYKFCDKATLLQLFTSLVRPHLEYAAPVWDPHLQRDIQLLEGVQTFACRMYTKAWKAGYEELLSTLQLPSLSNRRLFLKLCTSTDRATFLNMYFLPGKLGHVFVDLCMMFTHPFARTNSYLQEEARYNVFVRNLRARIDKGLYVRARKVLRNVKCIIR